MASSWRVQDHDESVDTEGALRLIEGRMRGGQCETWFENELGEKLVVVTNGQRAMVMLLQGIDDEGEHAIDLSASGTESSGYVISNGQLDTYPDRDTAPLWKLPDLVRAVFEGSERPADDWAVDR